MQNTATLISAVAATFCGVLIAQAQQTPIGTTSVERWPDGKKAAFMMMFDDGCLSHVNNVIPELAKRNMKGTFYVIPNKGEYKARLAFWENEAPKIPVVAFGNHSFSHKGYSSVENADEEMVKANDNIVKLFPGKTPRLISYATPGGVKSEISGEQIQEIAAKHHLIIRPTFQGHGAAIHYKTSESILKDIDKAATGDEAAYVNFHGVGGDWISFPMDQFTLLLDGLEARRETVWIADTISVHKYETERATAKAVATSTNAREIKVTLSCDADASLYDQPLSLSTQVPAAWKRCKVAQGTTTTTVDVVDGKARYPALPGANPIVLSQAR
jgi:peptidoglycan/xylan/chitin deacetylase (PgdA/CDA1 family)